MIGLIKHEEHLLALAEHEEEIVLIKGKAFLVRPATDADIERISKGYFCMD